MPVFDLQTKSEICSLYSDGMLLCVQGNMNLLVNGAKYKFARGSLCFIGQLTNVEILSRSEDCIWKLISDTSDDMFPVASHVLDTVIKNKLFNKTCIQLDEKQIGKFLFFVDLIEEKQLLLDRSQKEDFAMLSHSMVLLKQCAIMEFVVFYFRNLSIVPQKVSRGEKVAYDFVGSLYKNFYTEQNVDWYADKANLTPTYFSKVVRQYTGITPIEWIKNVRIVNAKMLLAQSQLSIKEVAVKLNFADQLSFRKFFKNCTGMSPKQYRETLR